MRALAIAVVLCVVFTVPALAEERVSFSPFPGEPQYYPTLVQRVGDGICLDEAARLEFRQSVMGDMAPPGYEPAFEHGHGLRDCDLVCPANTPCMFLETEPDCYDGFIDEWNGGCNSSPEVFDVITPYYGTISICGTSGMYDAGSTRDTDWFEFVLTQPSDIVFRCIAEFDCQMLIIDGSGGCPVYDYMYGEWPLACEEGVIEASLPAGTYWLWIGPQFGDAWPCGSDYIATLEGLYAAPDCAVDCPPFSFFEEELLCLPDYEDLLNGGCNSVPPVFQTLEPSEETIFLCGQSGVYSYYGMCYRDTDWYELVLDEPRNMEFCYIAGFEFHAFLMAVVDGCNEYVEVGSVLYQQPCDIACVNYSLDPGTYWLIFLPSQWVPVDCGRGYVVTISGYTTPVEESTWGGVKALYR